MGLRRPSSSGVGRKCFSYPESSGAKGWGGSLTGTCSISSTSRMGESPGGWAWGTSFMCGRLKLLLAGSGIFSQTQWGSTLCCRWTHLPQVARLTPQPVRSKTPQQKDN